MTINSGYDEMKCDYATMDWYCILSKGHKGEHRSQSFKASKEKQDSTIYSCKKCDLHTSLEHPAGITPNAWVTIILSDHRNKAPLCNGAIDDITIYSNIIEKN